MESIDKDAELSQLRARHAQLEAERAEREAALEEQDELSVARRAVRDAEALNAAIAEHGRLDVAIKAIETTIGLIIVKRASSMRFRRYQDQGEFTTTTLQQLITPSLVYPDKERFHEMVDEQPALLAKTGNAIAWLAGVRKEDIEKK